jgi:hypothetical protein
MTINTKKIKDEKVNMIQLTQDPMADWFGLYNELRISWKAGNFLNIIGIILF